MSNQNADLANATISAEPCRVLGAYYPSWKVYRGCKPSDLRLDLLTHVFYAFGRLKDDGTVYSLDEHADASVAVDGASGCFAAFAELKRQRNTRLRVVLTVGGGSGSKPFEGVAKDPAKTRRFCETLKQTLEHYQLDGVDREWCLRHIDLGALVKSTGPDGVATLDHINLMCYDFAGPWTGMAGHHAQLNPPPRPFNAFSKRSISGIVHYLVRERGIHPGKLVIGVPTYGRSFLGVNGPGAPFSGHGGDQDGVFEYRELPRPGTREMVDREAGAAWCLGGDGGWVSYDNPATVARKARFVKENGLGGMFFWTGASDARAEARSLVVAGHNAMQ